MSPSPVTCSEGCFCAAFACPACAPHLQLPGAPRCLGEPPCAKSGAFAARAIPLERAVARGCREAGARVAMNCTSIARLADMNRDVPVHDTRHIKIVCNVWPATLAWTPAKTSYSTSTVGAHEAADCVRLLRVHSLQMFLPSSSRLGLAAERHPCHCRRCSARTSRLYATPPPPNGCSRGRESPL